MRENELMTAHRSGSRIALLPCVLESLFVPDCHCVPLCVTRDVASITLWYSCMASSTRPSEDRT